MSVDSLMRRRRHPPPEDLPPVPSDDRGLELIGHEIIGQEVAVVEMEVREGFCVRKVDVLFHRFLLGD